MGSLRSFDKLNRYIKESPEREFFSFTSNPKEGPLSSYKKKISGGEVHASYSTTPFGIYAFPFKYFFLDKSVKTLSDFFYLLSKGVVKERIERGGDKDLDSERAYSETHLSEVVKRIMSKSILNFFLSNDKFPPEKMKKAFQEIKKVLSTGSR